MHDTTSAASDGHVSQPHYASRVLRAWPADRPHHEVRGTVISVDIVGFTPLSEALAEHGRVGAEELVGLVNEVFTQLIDVSDGLGGDILTFGGDAMTIVLSGDGHAARAAAIAVGMHRVMTRPWATPSAGAVDLSMSIGLGGGSVWYLPIAPGHLDLVVTGTAVTAALQAESAAAGGQVVLDAATVEALPAGWVVDAGAAGGPLLLQEALTDFGDLGSRSKGPPDAEGPDRAGEGRHGDVWDWDEAGDRAEVRDDDELVPARLRELIDAGLTVGEHRLTTIAFIALDGLVTRIAESGPDAVAAAVARLGDVLEAALAETGVSWLQSDTSADGAKILLAAGSPVSTGQDERAMLRLVSEVLAADLDLDLRIGVNRGRTFGGFVGSSTSRRSYSSMGDATNVAARLMGRTPPGGATVARAVLDAAGGGAVIEPLAPLTLKGKSRPVAAARFLRLDRRQADLSSDDLPFVGREHERTMLGEPLRRIAAGALEGRAMAVVGSPGIGKTRLIDEVLAEHSEDLAELRFGAERFDRLRPFLGARLLLRRLEPRLDGAASDVTTVLDSLLGADADLGGLLADLLDVELPQRSAAEAVAPAFRLARTAQLVGTLVGALVTRPTVIVIEDMQWLDESSRTVLAAIARASESCPLVVLLTGDGPEVIPAPTTTVQLGVLADDDATALVRTRSPDLPDRVVRRVVAAGTGNPLFLEELTAQIAQEQGGGLGTSIEDVSELPTSIDALVTAQMDALPAADRLMLRDACVVGTTFDADLLGLALGEEPDLAWAARVSAFIHPVGEGVWRFSQDIYRTIAYESLSFRRREKLHGRLAAALEDRGADVGVLALHFDRARLHEQAWRYGVAAAERAAAAHAASEAASLFARALAHAASSGAAPAQVAEVVEQHGDVKELTGDLSGALASFDDAAGLGPPDPEALSRRQRKASLVLIRQGQLSQAIVRQAKALLHADDVADPTVAERLRAAVRVGAAGLAYREGRYADGLADALNAAHHAVEGGSRGDLAHAFQLADLCRKAQGLGDRYDGWAAPMFAAAGDLVGEANALNNQGIAAFYAGRWDDALAAYERSAAVRSRAGDVLGHAMSINNIAEVLSDQGRLDRAHDMFSSASRDWKAVGYVVGQAIADSNIGRVAARRGDHAAGRVRLERALERFTAINAAQFVVETSGRLAECDLAAGETAAALHRLDMIGEEQMGVLPAVTVWLQRLRGQALLADGQTAAASAVLHAVLEDPAEVVYEQMWAAALLGDVERRDSMAQRLGVDLDVFSSVLAAPC